MPKSHRFAVAAVIAAGLLAYANSFSVPFMRDDIASIQMNPTTGRLWPPQWLTSPPGMGNTVHGRPILNLSFALNRALFGHTPASYHAVNLAIHLANALLLFAILGRLLPNDPRSSFRVPGAAFFIALLFLLHPLQTEAVTYLVQRAESLAAFFMLLTLFALVRYAAGDPQASPHRRWAILAVLACAAGMATKETMITAPLAAILLDRAYLAGTWRDVWRRRRRLHLVLLATWGIQLAIQLQPGTAREARTGFGAVVSPWHYLLTQSEVLLHYLRLAIWPSPLVFDYQWPIVSSFAAAWPAFIVVAALVAATLWLWLRSPRLAFPALAFFLILAPTSSIMPIADAAAEHRMYLPLAALLALAVISSQKALCRTPPASPPITDYRSPITAFILALAVLLGMATVARNRDYRTALALWEDTIAKRPGNARAWYNRGYLYEKAGNPGAAIADYRQALSLNPDYAGPYYNLGNLDLEAGRLDDAVANYTRAIQRERGNALPYYNRGVAKIRLGRADEAMADFDACIRIAPKMANAYLKRADIHAQFDRYADAITDYTRAIQRDATLADAWHNRAAAYAMLGNIPAAREDLIQCRRLGSEPAPELIDMVGGLEPAR